MKFNPESQNHESDLAFEQIKHIEEDVYNTETEETGGDMEIKLENYFDDGFDDNGEEEVMIGSYEDIEAFERAYGVSFESIIEKKHNNAA